MPGTRDLFFDAMDGTQQAPNSTCIRRWQYLADSAELRIKFMGATSATYTYKGVPPEVVAGLYEAPSVGQFYNAVIKGRYPQEKT